MASAEKAMRDAENQALFVAKNRAKQCRRCKADPTDSVGTLDKRGYCEKCAAVRIASMPPETTDGPEKPKPGESTEQCNARLARNKEKIDGARKVLTQVTPQQLLRGDSGRPQVTGTALNHATAAVSLRTSIASTTKDLIGLENFVTSGAGNAAAAWHNYISKYQRLLKWVDEVKWHEEILAKQVPELVREKILLPKRLEQPAARAWEEV